MRRFGVALLLVACNKTPTAAPAPSDAGVRVVTLPCSETAPLPAPPPPPPAVIVADAGPPPPFYIREVKTISVDDVDETWVLRWRGKPDPDCVKPDERTTCPCWGFAFGERGALELARLRPGEPEDRFVFRDHLEEDPSLQRWEPRDDDPVDKIPADLAKRESVDVMQFADFDHDGRATEFLFRIGFGAGCGHTSVFRAIGITKKQPKLHFFTPTLSSKKAWDQVLKMDVPGSITTIDWACGDHGTTEEESTVVALDAAGTFRVTPKTRRCRLNE